MTIRGQDLLRLLVVAAFVGGCTQYGVGAMPMPGPAADVPAEPADVAEAPDIASEIAQIDAALQNDDGDAAPSDIVASDGDTKPTDAGPTDSGPTDSGPTDSGPTDSGPTDTGPKDIGQPDIKPDAKQVDTQQIDVQPDVDVAGPDADAVTPAKVPVVDLVVDANRDGVAKPTDPADQDFGEVSNAEHGAIFLANVDDDDLDGLHDADDEVVNGSADVLDLAPIVISAWPAAPAGAIATLTLDAASASHVRVFRLQAGSWTQILGVTGGCVNGIGCTGKSVVTLGAQVLAVGAQLGIEANGFRMAKTAQAWDGTAHLTWSVAIGPTSTTDKVRLRVAPWVLNGNLSPFDLVRSDVVHKAFVNDLNKALPPNGIDYEPYTNWNDQWTQDFYQTAWTAMPAVGGGLHGMRVAIPRPWGRAAGTQWLPIAWLNSTWIGPDRGVQIVYKVANTGSTYDSYGNHDLLPPYVNGAANFPIGQIIHGSNILPETHAFYDAQGVQGPSLVVKTDWLAVGHVDEVLSYVPAKTARGWKLLVASDDMAKQMFEKAQAAGYGSVAFWTGMQNYNPTTGQIKDAEMTINETLADVDLMQWSQQAEVHTAGVLATVQATVGLADDEIVPIPFLSEDVGGGSASKPHNKISWQPGTVNSLVWADHFAAPHPFGPVINGKDMFAQDLFDRLGTAVNLLGSAGKGLTVHLIDDWYSYHINMGEVHCGTNPEGPPPVAAVKWWTIGK